MNLDPFGIFSEDELWMALDKTHLKEYVLNLDKKLSFEVVEGGENLRLESTFF